MWAAAVVLLGSVAAAAVVAVVAVLPVLLPVAVGPAHLAHKRLPLLHPLHLLRLRSPRVVVESEVPLHPQDRQSFSAVTARSSPPTGKPMW